VYLVGFIIIKYHDARSSECQICIINLRFPYFRLRWRLHASISRNPTRQTSCQRP